jgi:hypothetical protein
LNRHGSPVSRREMENVASNNGRGGLANIASE